MLALHVLSAGISSIRILVVILGIAAVIFWRAALKIITALFVILLALGSVAFIEGFAKGIR